MKNALRVCTLLGFALVNASPVAAQAGPTPPEADPPNLLAIYREEVKPGKAAAHSSNEQAWAAAFTKGQAPIHWLGMTTIAGPNEAWFFSRYDSFAALQKVQDAMESSAALTADVIRWMEEHEYASLAQLRGSLNLARCPDPAAFERGNYVRLLQRWRHE